MAVIIKRADMKNGKTRVIIELDPGEELKVIDPKSHYQLGYPHDDIVCGNHITEAKEVMWCVVEQKWVE